MIAEPEARHYLAAERTRHFDLPDFPAVCRYDGIDSSFPAVRHRQSENFRLRHHGQERFPDDRTYFGACHIPLELIGRENDFHRFTMLSQECR